jgi:hypothetical protein
MNTMSRALRKPQSVFIQASTLSSPIHDFLSELRGFWGTDSLLHCHSFLQCCQRCSGVSLTPAILDGFCLSFQNCEMGADGCSCLRLLKKTPGLELVSSRSMLIVLLLLVMTRGGGHDRCTRITWVIYHKTHLLNWARPTESEWRLHTPI